MSRGTVCCSGFAVNISAQELFQDPLPSVSPVTKVAGGNQNSEQMTHQAKARNLVAALLHPFDAWLSYTWLRTPNKLALDGAIIIVWLPQSKLQCMRYSFQIFINMRVYSCLAQQTCVTPSVWPRRSWPRQLGLEQPRWARQLVGDSRGSRHLGGRRGDMAYKQGSRRPWHCHRAVWSWYC